MNRVGRAGRCCRRIGLPLWFVVAATGAHAADRDEAVAGDLSGNGLAPSTLQLDYSVRANGSGYNVISGSTGRSNGVVDRDYLHVVVPEGYSWSELRVGMQTTIGGPGGSFIGLAAGSSISLSPSATSAEGLLGWRHYGIADRGNDIFDDMAVPNNGSSGFGTPLAAGDYTLWIQELATGSFNYRFNLVLTPVPEAASLPAMLSGVVIWGLAGFWRRARGGLRRSLQTTKPALFALLGASARPVGSRSPGNSERP